MHAERRPERPRQHVRRGEARQQQRPQGDTTRVNSRAPRQPRGRGDAPVQHVLVRPTRLRKALAQPAVVPAQAVQPTRRVGGNTPEEHSIPTCMHRSHGCMSTEGHKEPPACFQATAVRVPAVHKVRPAD